MTATIRIKTLIRELENLAPPSLQESYDNAQLHTGNSETECTGVLVCLDCTEEIVTEAVERGCNLIVCHHPVIFKGLKSLTGKDHVERIIISAIKNEIAIYAIHTNLDNVLMGVNKRICEVLGLTQTKILSEKSDTLKKLTVTVPEENAEELRVALFGAGAGQIGDYKDCSFSLIGTGTFTPGENTNPSIGEKNVPERIQEVKVEVLLPSWKATKVLTAMRKVHPYEEVAYYLTDIANKNQETGSGMTGILENEMPAKLFLAKLKDVFNIKLLRYSGKSDHLIKKVAVCGGAGFFLMKDAIHSGSDIYITSDIKYHDFFEADRSILLADIGHYESEQFTIELLQEYLTEKFPNFAVLKTKLNTNPVHWL